MGTLIWVIPERAGWPGLAGGSSMDSDSAAVITSGVRMPRMNSIMQRWIQTRRRELPNRTLIWNQRHLLYALREFEIFCTEHRPHRFDRSLIPTSTRPRSPP
ncbi:hypothetical protein [Nonomuraea phyllanthi]|uniref:hypothetical protein n=1 Tax=Nonomuraea phyllanthi TaxID=2219224 RepID=UPI001D13BCA2|nr:hypothetical protein [Nonomuraea phyllanthi]